MQLDIKTSLVIAILVSLIPSLISVLIWQTRRTCPGFGHWTLGNLLGAFCLVFISLRGMAPDWISIVVANALALGAAIMFLEGIRLFRGLQVLWWPEYLAGGLAIAAVIYFRYATNNLSARAVVMSGVLGIFGLLSGFTLLRQVPARRRISTGFTGLVFILAGAVMVVRTYFYASVPASDLLAPSNANAAFFAATGLGALGWSLGFLLMLSDHRAVDSTAMPVRTETAPQPVPETEVLRQLRRIVESDVFRRSARMERFLMVAAERALSGHAEDLKEYSLGRDVFNRGEDYDPRTDSIVRVEAQRLRRKLREYYQSDGSHDPVIVEIHPGSYVPRFRYKEFGTPNR